MFLQSRDKLIMRHILIILLLASAIPMGCEPHSSNSDLHGTYQISSSYESVRGEVESIDYGSLSIGPNPIDLRDYPRGATLKWFYPDNYYHPESIESIFPVGCYWRTKAANGPERVVRFSMIGHSVLDEDGREIISLERYFDGSLYMAREKGEVGFIAKLGYEKSMEEEVELAHQAGSVQKTCLRIARQYSATMQARDLPDEL